MQLNDPDLRNGLQAKSTEDFKTYRALVLADPNLVGYTPFAQGRYDWEAGPSLVLRNVFDSGYEKWGPAITG